MNFAVPKRAFFSFAAPCRYRGEAPRVDGDLGDWDSSFRLPDLLGLEGEKPFAELLMAWNDDGLYFAVSVAGKKSFTIDPKNYWQGDCLELWIDTRDVKDAHTANRFCHHFFFLPGGSGRDGRKPIGRQTAIDRAREQAPPCPEEEIAVGLKRLKRSYRLEISLPAAGLHGFEPREFDRLGFNYVLHDCDRGTQSWTAGRNPPLLHDPGTWGTVLLAE